MTDRKTPECRRAVAAIACLPLALGCLQASSDRDRAESATTLRAHLTIAEDADQDDVRNDDDLCPSTPTDETTDGDGCGLVTQDADLDGVGDGRDACAATPAGDHVDAMGCAASQGGQLPVVPAGARDTGDVFDLPGWNPTSAVCGESEMPRVAVDRDGDGLPDTLVVVTRLAGSVGLNNIGTFPAFDYTLDMVGLCTSPLAAEVSIRFVDMNAPGFDRDAPSTWSFTTVPAARVNRNSDFLHGTRFDVTAFTPGGASALAFRSGASIFSHRDGVADIRAFTDYSENFLDNLRLFVQPPNTPFGSNVTVNLDNGRVRFTSVAVPGNSFITSTPAAADTPLPAGVTVCAPREPASYFRVETSATASGPSQVCVNYAQSCAGPPTEARAFATICGGPSGCTSLWRSLDLTIDAANTLACFSPGSAPFIVVGAQAPADTGPPRFLEPNPVTITGRTPRPPNGQIVTFTVAAFDDTGSLPVACSPASGSLFLLGRTTVTCVAANAAGNTASLQFPIDVKGPGDRCSSNECASGFCVDGVCCDQACGGGSVAGCAACSTAAGASADGVCTLFPSGTTCRGPAGACDATEICDGVAAACPADGVKDNAQSCGPAPGLCQTGGFCGGNVDCPALSPLPECSAVPLASCNVAPCPPVTAPGANSAIDHVTATFPPPTSDGEISVQPCGAVAEPTNGYKIVTNMASGGDELACVDLEVSSTYNGSVEVCLYYTDDLLDDGMGGTRDPSTFELWHDDGSGFQPITTYRVDATAEHGPGLCGNVTTFSPFAIVVPVDTTPPVFGNLPPDPLIAYATSTGGAAVNFAPTAVDAVDGPVGVSCTRGPGVFSVGTTLVTCTATDASHNTATTSFTVWVQYQAPADGSFFLKPIRPDDSSVFKVGRAVPVKFALTGASAGITNLIARLSVTQLSGSVSGRFDCEGDEDGEDTDMLFKYRKAKGIYGYRWKTRSETKGTYELRADLGDGVVHKVKVSLKAAR